MTRKAVEAGLADLRSVMPSWLAARMFVALGYLLAVSVANFWVPGGRTSLMSEGLIAWDGTYYRDIAAGGYSALPLESLRFFPLYPLVGRGLSALFLNRPGLALLVIANLCSLLAAVIVRRLVLFEKADEAMAERAVWITALFPSAFVFVWAYSEGLFLLTTLGAFYAARHRRFAVAAAFGVLGALSRPTGVLLAAPLIIEGAHGWREASTSDRATRAAAAGAPLAGLGLYLVWVGHRFGDMTLPFSTQSALRGQAVEPLTRLIRGVGDLFGPQRFGVGLHVPFALAFVALIVLTFRRWPLSYGVFALLVLVVALSADNLNSLERYALNGFPLMFALASVTGRPRVERACMAVCGGGLVSLSALAWLGVYVP